MSNTFSQVLKTLTGSREGVLSSADVFPLVDVDQVAAELRLIERGTEDGKADLPPTDSLDETTAEADVRSEINRRAAVAAHEYRVQDDLYVGRIRRGLLAADLRTSIEAAGERALSDFRVQATDDLSHLDEMQRDIVGRQREFDAFRATNRLERLPRLPKAVTFRRMVLALVILLEAIINGLFFAQGSQTGLIGGVTQAIVLSFFNIGVALAFSLYGLPYIRHARPLLRVWGTVSATVYFFVVTGLNLSIGHFRDLYSQHEGVVPIAQFISHLQSAPLRLADTNSLILVILGIAFNFVALVDAFGLDDPYPGYGAVSTRKNEATEKYAKNRSHCLDDLRARRDEAITEMSQVIEEVRSKEYDVQLAVNGRGRLQQQYAAYGGHLRECHARLVARYREANARARHTQGPAAFSTAPKPLNFGEHIATEVEVVVDRTSVAHVIERMEFFIRAISKAYDEQAARYPAVNQLVDSARTALEHV